jgi:hypothetical protein
MELVDRVITLHNLLIWELRIEETYVATSIIAAGGSSDEVRYATLHETHERAKRGCTVGRCGSPRGRQ